MIESRSCVPAGRATRSLLPSCMKVSLAPAQSNSARTRRASPAPREPSKRSGWSPFSLTRPLLVSVAGRRWTSANNPTGSLLLTM
ncbi:hypothetical protein D3C83_37220 [compost metagenome]